ncbi:MAG: hypothetical protein ABW208_15070 [Pyrinomonadaceae bacterium]
MPINHDEATASIHVTGLSLGCVNSHTKKWEVCFIGEPEHNLVMKVTKITAAGEDERPEACPDSRPIAHGSRIFIEATKPAATSTTLYKPSLAGRDKEDFRLIVDMEKKVYKGKNVKPKKPLKPITEMYVSGAKLYSVKDATSKEDVWLVRKDKDEQPRELKKIGTAAGADIKCKPGGAVVIKVDGPAGGFECTLPREEGTRYIVWFDNMCPPPPAEVAAAAAGDAAPRVIKKLTRKGRAVVNHSDFMSYYEVINPEGKGYYDLTKGDPRRGDGAVCNYTHLGNLDWMFPLPIA